MTSTLWIIFFGSVCQRLLLVLISLAIVFASLYLTWALLGTGNSCWVIGMPLGTAWANPSPIYKSTHLDCFCATLEPQLQTCFLRFTLIDHGLSSAGDALFQTHENLEHLAMMETVLGRIPESMAASASENARNYFMHRHVPCLPHTDKHQPARGLLSPGVLPGPLCIVSHAICL